MVINALKLPDYSDLIQKYGEKNVEDTAIYIAQANNLKGFFLNIKPTQERMAEVLDAVHREFLY